MMRKLYFMIIALFFTAMMTYGQNFEGKIIYANTYTSKNPQITSEQWSAMLGATQEYLIKEGSYKSIANGTLVEWNLYDPETNRLYTKMTNSQTAIWDDCSKQYSELLNIEVNKNVTEVLGYSCDEVILTTSIGVQKYYYSSKLAVNSELFAAHKLGHWYDFLSKSKAVSLKSIVESEQFVIETIATEVTPMKLDDKVFELPSGLKTEKSPY